MGHLQKQLRSNDARPELRTVGNEWPIRSRIGCSVSHCMKDVCRCLSFNSRTANLRAKMICLRRSFSSLLLPFEKTHERSGLVPQSGRPRTNFLYKLCFRVWTGFETFCPVSDSLVRSTVRVLRSWCLTVECQDEAGHLHVVSGKPRGAIRYY